MSDRRENEQVEAYGRVWLIRQAVSLKAAMDCIAMAAVRGSVGGKYMVNGEVTADVVALNADGTERQPS